MQDDLAAMRVEYGADGFGDVDAGSDPMRLFHAWLAAAREAQDDREANAMTLATVGADGTPSARMVLLKETDADAASFTWFTNLDSRKGAELGEVPRAALCWWWPMAGDVPGRQVRAVGHVEPIGPEASARYFHGRPAGARIGAAASRQSRAIATRAELDQRAALLDGDVPMPVRWGGLRLIADELEFWQGRQGRLHDRIAFLRLDADGTPRSTAAVAAAGGIEQLRAAANVVTDRAGSAWLRTRLEP